MNLSENSKDMMMFDVATFATHRENNVSAGDVDKFKSELGDAVKDLDINIKMIQGQHAAAASVHAKYDR